MNDNHTLDIDQGMEHLEIIGVLSVFALPKRSGDQLANLISLYFINGEIYKDVFQPS